MDLDINDLHPMNYINVFTLVKENRKSFEKHFLDGHTEYNMADHSYNSMMTCIVYLQFPETVLGQYQYKVTYDQIYFWMHNHKMMDFLYDRIPSSVS